MLAALIFLATFALYLCTSTGTVPAYRDSGDLINAIHTLGIAHPPGYPVYVFVGKLVHSLVPWGNPAYRTNLVSALCIAGTAALLMQIVASGSGRLRLTAQTIALIAALGFTFSPAVLALGRVAEMYAMAALFGAAIIHCAQYREVRWDALGCLLVGLGFGVHPTLIFLAPLFVRGRPATWLWRVTCFSIGFSVVLLLWVRAQSNPLQNWGNPTTLNDLWRLITRSNYGGLKLHPVESQFLWTVAGVFAQLKNFVQSLFLQWGVPGAVVGAVGAVVASRRDVRLLVCWLIAGPLFFVLSNLPLEANTTAPILEPYWVLINLVWAIWLAVALLYIAERFPKAAVAAVALLVAIVPLVRVASGFQSYRSHFYAYDLARNMLRSLPPQAALLDPDDPLAFTLRSLQLNEARRSDVALLNFYRTFWGYEQIKRRWPDLLPPGSIHSAQELEQAFWDFGMKQRPFFADLPVKVPPALHYRVAGLVYPLQRTATSPTADELRQAERAFQFYSFRGVWRSTAHRDFFTRQILNYAAAARCNLGLRYAEIQNWDAARVHYVQALAIDPHLAAAYNNLGVADFQQRQYASAVQRYIWALRYDPKNAGFRRNLAYAYQANGQPELARHLLETP
jgi:tetratricopeptide (TPR) repeat protein